MAALVLLLGAPVRSGISVVPWGLLATSTVHAAPEASDESDESDESDARRRGERSEQGERRDGEELAPARFGRDTLVTRSARPSPDRNDRPRTSQGWALRLASTTWLLVRAAASVPPSGVGRPSTPDSARRARAWLQVYVI